MDNFRKVKAMMEIYSLFITLRVFFKEKTYNVLINRSDVLVDFKGLQLHKRFMWVPTDIMTKEDIVEFEYSNIITQYREELSDYKTFSLKGWIQIDEVEAKKNHHRDRMNLMEAKKWYKMTDVYGERSFVSYHPNMFELTLLTEEERKKNLYDKSKALNIRTKYLELVSLMSERDLEIDPLMGEMTAEETASKLSSFSQREEMSWKDIRTYFKLRHDVFANLFQAANSMDTEKTDVPMREFFEEELTQGMEIMLNKTPDMILETGMNVFLIIEFAVTDSDAVLRVQEKVDKYGPAVNHINKFKNKEVDLMVFVLDMETLNIHSYPETTGMSYPDCLFIKEVHNKVKVLPNFDRYRKMMELGLSEEKTFRMESIMMDLIKLTERPALRNTKAASLLDSRACNENFELLTNEEDLELQRVVGRESNLTKERMANIFMESYQKGESFAEMFCPEVVKMTEDTTEEGLNTVLKEMEEIMMSNSKMREVTKDKIPTVFKYPWLDRNMEAGFNPRSRHEMIKLQDGTLLFKAKTEIEETVDDEWNDSKDTAGIGFSEEDMSLMDSLMEFLREGMDEWEKDYYNRMKNSKMWECLDLWEEMTREIGLMSDRRFAVSKSPEYFALKKFDHFWLEMHKGSKMTKEKQVRFRLHMANYSGEKVQLHTNPFFKAFTERNERSLSTKWLAMSLMDFEHFQTISSRCRLLLKHITENAKADSVMTTSMISCKTIPVFVMVPMLIMMEHKRNTSTSAQAARYVMHNVTSLLSDSRGVLGEITSVPIRTRMQAFVVRSQMLWMMHMLKKPKLSMIHFGRMMEERTSFDKVHMPSMYDLDSTVEFSVMMDEIYYSNIFNQKMGFRSHREKAIWEKQAKEERNYRDISWEERKENPFEDFHKMKDKHHTYSSEMIRLAMRDWFMKSGNKASMLRANLEAESETVEEIVKMTRSVVSGPTSFTKFLDYSREVEKVSVLEAVSKELEKTPLSMLADMCARDEEIFAIFSTFAKDQFGGAREILVQSVRTRMHTAYLNRFFKKLCEFHEKEMITKEKKKADKQSSTCVIMKDLFIQSAKENSDYINIPIVINADASKWAPSMVMEYFIEMLAETKIDTALTSHMISIFRAYSAKILFLPKSLKEKWLKKPNHIKERSEDLQWVREEVDLETGMMIFFSGMGQGNFQHPSSFLHCLIDDLMDSVLEMVFERLGFKILVNVSLISSDDSTKMLSIRILYDKWEEKLLMALLVLADLFTTVRKAANIHINWKKTAIQALIVEFNSMFSVGKRVALAVIKSLYNSQNIVDMTMPEKAVKEVISHCRPLLEEGATIPTVELALELMRKKLIKWYNLESYIPDLCSLLDCKEEDLPGPLGFIPVKDVVETFIYGLEYHYVGSSLSASQLDFYKGLYSADMSVIEQKPLVIDYEEAVTSKFMIKLNTRLDKKVEEMKKRVIRDRKKLEETMEKWAMMEMRNPAIMQELDLYLQERIVDLTLQYEFSESFRFNSMIRAMQFSSKPFMTNAGVNGGEFLDVREFVIKMKERANEVSSYSMLRNLEKIKAEMVAEKSKLKNMVKKERSSHDKYRTIRFQDVTTEAYASESEILKCIMSTREKAKIRVFKAVKEVVESLNLEMEEMFDNPFYYISKAFSLSKTPFTDFRNYLRTYVKMFFHSSMRIVCDFKPEVKKARNVLQLYMTKSVAGCVLRSTSWETSSDKVKFLDNLMLLQPLDRVKLNIRSILSAKEEKIHANDSRKEWAMKVIAASGKNNEIALWKIAQNRELYFFSRKASTSLFADDKATVMVKIENGVNLSLVNITVRAHKNRILHFELTSMMKALVEKEIINRVHRLSSARFWVNTSQKVLVESLKDIWKTASRTEVVAEWDLRCRLIKETRSDHWSLKAMLKKAPGLPVMTPCILVSDIFKFHPNLELTSPVDDEMNETTFFLENMLFGEVTLKEMVSFAKKMQFFKTNMEITQAPQTEVRDIERRVDVANDNDDMLAVLGSMSEMFSSIAEAAKDTIKEQQRENYDMITDIFSGKELDSFFSVLREAIADARATHLESLEDELEVVEESSLLPDNLVVTTAMTNSLWNCFRREMVISTDILNSYIQDQPAINASMAFTDFKVNISAYLEEEVPDDIIYTLLMLTVKRTSAMWKAFPFSAIKDLSKTGSYNKYKTSYPKPRREKVPYSVKEELADLNLWV